MRQARDDSNASIEYMEIKSEIDAIGSFSLQSKLSNTREDDHLHASQRQIMSQYFPQEPSSKIRNILHQFKLYAHLLLQLVLQRR